jgi:hypothetical protein
MSARSRARRTGVAGAAGGTGERVAREPLTGRVSRGWSQVVGSGPVGERATPTPGQDPPLLLPRPQSAGSSIVTAVPPASVFDARIVPP